MISDTECKKILSKLGLKLGVSPKLIATKLLSDLDKKDMKEGNLSLEALECHVKVWLANKCPDYVSETSK